MARKKKTEEKVIDNNALPIPELGKELKSYNGSTFAITVHEFGILYHVYNSMDLVIRPSQESAYYTLLDIVEQSEVYNEKTEEEKTNFDLYVSAITYVLNMPLFAFTDADFLFKTASNVIDFLKASLEKEKELVERNMETIARDEAFVGSTMGIETITTTLNEELGYN